MNLSTSTALSNGGAARGFFCLPGGRGPHVEVVVGDGAVVVAVVDGVEFVAVVVVFGVSPFQGQWPLSSPFRLMMNFLSRCALRTSAVAVPVALPFHSGSGLEKYMMRVLYSSLSYL